MRRGALLSLTVSLPLSSIEYSMCTAPACRVVDHIGSCILTPGRSHWERPNTIPVLQFVVCTERRGFFLVRRTPYL